MADSFPDDFIGTPPFPAPSLLFLEDSLYESYLKFLFSFRNIRMASFLIRELLVSGVVDVTTFLGGRYLC